MKGDQPLVIKGKLRPGGRRHTRCVGSGAMLLSSSVRGLSSFLGLASLLVVGCSSEIEETPAAPPSQEPQETPVAPAPGPPFTISWGSCTIPGGRGGPPIEAECATVDAPARRGVEGSGTTPVAVYRLKSKKQPASAQMWMLNGGPGGAGFSLAPYGKMMTTLPQGVDVYLVDHRGTGASSFLECPRAMATAGSLSRFAKACSDEIRDVHGDALDGFSTTESAHDVRELIESTATEEQKVYVYGGSYGSYWAHRLVQLPDTRVDALVTDGNCLGDTCTFDTPQSFGVDEAMRHILEVCRDTPECSAKLGDDPWAFAAGTLEKIAGGHCADSALAAWAPADIAASLGVYWAAGLMPVLYRLDRCSAEDVAVLDTLETKLREIGRGRIASVLPNLGPTPKPSAETSYSTALLLHVVASEMISRPAPTASSLAVRAEALTFKPDPSRLDISYFDAWEGYPRDEHVGGWVKRDVPWLMMQGTFDFQTVYSLSEKALEHVENPNIQLVRIDGGGHGVVFASACSLAMLERFLADPKAKVDASCVADVKKASLDLDDAYTHYFFGTLDAWGEDGE
jgi:pimeloyl-ACP methyl ester carboxylesterase